MKKYLKEVLESAAYRLDRSGIVRLYAPVKVMSIDDTISEIVNSGKSLVRFGDADLTLIRGRSEFRQKESAVLRERLKKILGYSYDDLLVTIPDIFDGVEQYVPKTQKFWKDHLFFYSRYYREYCSPDRVYGTTSVTRSYITLKDKSKAKGQFQRLKEAWNGKNVTIVEGITTHNGVGNDLLDNAGSVRRILIPPTNAFDAYDRILAACLEEDRDRMFLISAGATAKPLTEDLFLRGYRVLDIGNLDMEYEWCLSGVSEKQPIAKHGITGREANLRAGYTEYLDQVIAEISG